MRSEKQEFRIQESESRIQNRNFWLLAPGSWLLLFPLCLLLPAFRLLRSALYLPPSAFCLLLPALCLLLSAFCLPPSGFLYAVPAHPPVIQQGSVSRGPLVNPRDPELERNALHNLDVAQFYIKRKKWPAAQNRLQAIVRDHPGFSRIVEVYFLLGEVYRKTKQRELAIELYSRVIEEFPQHELAERARDRLREMGAEPTKGPNNNSPPGSGSATGVASDSSRRLQDSRTRFQRRTSYAKGQQRKM